MAVKQQPQSETSADNTSNNSKRQFNPPEVYGKALLQFGELLLKQQQQIAAANDGQPDENGLSVQQNGTNSVNSNIENGAYGCCLEVPLVDEYFEFVAATGKTHLPWCQVQPVLVWKLQAVMNDMHIKDAESQSDDFAKEAMINNGDIQTAKQSVLEKARSFDDAPFTIQRICELLLTPTKHYHTIRAYLSALERNINVVTTITPDGMRNTGVEDPIEESDPNIPVERNFIVSVDELDEPLAEKLAKAKQEESMESDDEQQQNKLDEKHDDDVEMK